MTGQPRSRRQFLAGGAMVVGALAACSAGRRAPPASSAPPSDGPSTSGGAAAPPGSPSTVCATGAAALGQIDHVVIVIQENRSFDHLFGAYRGVRGFDDIGQFAQPGPGGPRRPFHLDTATTPAACTNDITHEWVDQHRCWNNGAMDGWARVHARVDGPDAGPVMGYYTRADVPWYYGLADGFTVCDAYHCSVFGPTDPNRLYALSATIDPTDTGGGPVVATESLATARAAQFSRTWTTMPERLSAQGVSWSVYQQPGFADSPLALAVSNNVLAYFRNYADPSTELYHRAFTPSWPGDFTSAAAAGQLPAVSWVLAPLGEDEHPPASVQVGEAFVGQVLAALRANPAAWAKTAVFLTYDENGGFFDHVAPPIPPRGAAGEYLRVVPPRAGGIAGPIGLGFRVPLLVVSPFSRGGWVCSDTFDHTSLLRFLETRFGVEVPILSAWRRAVTGDLTTTLDLTAPDTSWPSLPAPAGAADPVVVRECPPGEICLLYTSDAADE